MSEIELEPIRSTRLDVPVDANGVPIFTAVEAGEIEKYVRSSRLYFPCYKNVDGKLIPVIGVIGGTGSGSSWGTITGDIANQIDLQTLLSTFAKSSDLLAVDIELKDRISALLGSVAYLTASDFGAVTEESAQEPLTEYALQQHPEWEENGIPNSVAVQNLYDNIEWIYNAEEEKWINNGLSIVAQATEQLAGVMKLYQDWSTETDGAISAAFLKSAFDNIRNTVDVLKFMTGLSAVLPTPENFAMSMNEEITQLTLTWNQVPGYMYNIYCLGVDGIAWDSVAVGIDASTYVVTALIPQSDLHTFTYSIRAVQSQNSFSALAQSTISVALNVPQNLRGTANTKNITLTWDKTSEEKYTIYWLDDNNQWVPQGSQVNTASAAPSVSVNPNKNGELTFAVRSVKGAAKSGLSTPVTINYEGIVTPTVSGSLNGDNQPVLTWNAVPYVVTYRVYRINAAGTGWIDLSGNNFTATTFTDTTELAAGVYTYAVRSVAADNVTISNFDSNKYVTIEVS